MHRYILLLLVLAASINAGSQTNINITPEALWGDDNRAWSQYPPAFYNYNGTIFLFNMKENSDYEYQPYVYTWNVNHDNSALQPWYHGPNNVNTIEGFDIHHETPPASTCAFEFGGRLWFYCYSLNGDRTYGDFFAQMPVKQSDPFYSFTAKPFNDYFTKYSAFQFDSSLMFIGIVYQKGNPTVNNFWIEEYRYDSANNKFVHKNLAQVVDMPGNFFSGIIRRLDSNGKEYMLVNTFDLNGKSYLGKLVPGTSSSKYITFTYVQCDIPSAAMLASTLLQGTIKGGKSSDAQPQHSDRVSVAYISSGKLSDGTYPINYAEYYFQNDNPVKANYGTITLPKSNAPHPSPTLYTIAGVNELVPQDYTTEIPGIDGYQQRNWFLYPDHDYHFLGFSLTSDQWRLDPNSIVSSPDLADTATYPDINLKSMWSLSGIIDGAPPMSVNWPAWDTLHEPSTPASSLALTQSSTNLTEITNSYEDQWSYGMNMTISKEVMKVKVSIGGAFEHSNAYKASVENKTVITQSYGRSFPLYSYSQSNGFFLWNIPEIKRYTYSLYPWWETNALQYPVVNSMQFLFRTIGFSVTTQGIPLTSAPFNIQSANDLKYWTGSYRPSVVQNAAAYDLRQAISLNWDAHSCGSTGQLDVTVDSTSSFQNSVSLEASVKAGINVPDVFKLQGSTGYNVDFSTGTTVETLFEDQITASLENLYDKEDGTNVSSVDISVFLFKPELNPHWWFYEDLNGEKPWYLAYVVNSYFEGLNLLAPVNACELKSQDLVFSWQALNGDLHNYTFMLSKSPTFGTSNVLYRAATGNLTETALSGFRPEPGRTYYWAVKGYNDQEEIIWSSCRTFTLKPDENDSPGPAFKVQVYPNPGVLKDLRFTIMTEKEGEIGVVLCNADGQVVTEKTMPVNGSSTVSLSFPGLNLCPGFYYAVFTVNGERVIKKIVLID